MRHNLPVLPESPRTGARPLARRLLGLFVAVVAVCSFIWGMAPGAFGATQAFPSALGEVTPAAAPAVEGIEPQTAIVGKPFTLKIEGSEIAELKATSGLPAWLGQPEEIGSGEVQWEMVGTPTAAEPTATVHLLATNKAKETTETSFQLTVVEPEAAPTIEVEAEATATVGAPFSLPVKGARLHELVATGLPAELKPHQLSETEWEISGTPTAAKGATKVDLEAHNKEGKPATGSFNLTVKEAPPPPPPPAAITSPGDQKTVINQPVHLQVHGSEIATLESSGLPEGVIASRVSSTL